MEARYLYQMEDTHAPASFENEAAEQETVSNHGTENFNEEIKNENKEAIEAEDEEIITAQAITKETLLLCLISVLCLVFAFIFVGLYKRRLY